MPNFQNYIFFLTKRMQIAVFCGNITKRNSHPFNQSFDGGLHGPTWGLCLLAMTATVGVTFGAGSAAKRILLFAINVTVLVSVNVKIICRVFSKNVNSSKFLSPVSCLHSYSP